MSTPVARLGDSHSHGGTIISASAAHSADGIGVARVGDQIACPLHGVQTITGGSPALFADGRAVARVGSPCSCGATISSGSPKYECS